MTHFLDELRKGFRRGQVEGARVLVGVSGGADSVALLLGSVELAGEFSLEPVVAHLNHGLRGEASDADAAWVERLAGSLGLPIERGDLSGELLRDAPGGLEERARECRYRFFDEAARKRNCSTLLLAHTANDQAETVLHHLLRGTGLSGLTGIPFTRTTASGLRLVRPLLATTRKTIEDYLRERGQTFCTDLSNDDPAMTRNRLRHQILPILRDTVNPQVDEALARLAEQATDVQAILQSRARELLEQSILDVQPESCRLDVSQLSQQPRHLIREVFRELWQQQGWSRQGMGFVHWDRLADLLQNRKAVHLPDRVEARFGSETLLVLRRLR
ncbi:tRNA lysidine(34) synthetase TilS [Schlesneria sp. DSM 10557]|uniref:tRNA lysidine(34) synthetase TilS n=1 Tax=Schlesneria sp. DSM 10557 TaxID=3044399 RepID=UPI0035A0CCD6